MSRLTVGSIEGLTENSNVISVPTGHTLNAVDGLQIGSVGVGEYIDYSGSISISNLTLGDGSIVAQYARINDLVHYWGTVQWGSTTSLSGVPIHSVPIAAVSGTHWGNAVFLDDGVNDYYGRSLIYSGTNMLLRVMVHAGATNYVDFSEILNYIPFTWGVNDRWTWNIVYKAA